MKAEAHSIDDVLSKNNTSFFIPPFQRSYAWGKPEIDRFFSDVSRIIDSELNPYEQDKLEHFFGTIVIKNEKDGFASKSLIIDGQQRITTTLIFLIALRDLESDQTKKNYITKTYLINDSSTFQDKIKLKQVTKDWDAYKALVNGKQPIPGAIKNAYDLLKKLIFNKKNLNPEIKTDHFIIAIQRMNVAVIFLDERKFKGEDPQIIFETLNSLGKPLTLADLVRNYILLNLESEKQTNIYDNIWYPKIEKVLQDKTSEFFRDYLQYKTSSSLKVVSESNTKELYQKFKEFVEEKFNNSDELIEDIVPFVNYYKWIITEFNNDKSEKISTNTYHNKEIFELLRNIFHDIKSEAFKPFVLGLLDYHQSNKYDVKLSDEILISSLKTIRTYLIRRRVCSLTQGENKNIVLLCKRIKEIASGETTMFKLLTSLFYKLRLPNDIEVANILKELNFYEELKSYAKFILGKIEEHNSKVAVDFRDSKITIEHIMPQKLNVVWIKELGENYEEIHKKYLHNIGNLILTEFNTEMGNSSFTVKKNRLEKSTLSFRLDIINKDVWNEDNIIEHQKNMINWFLETFPLPNEYKERNNWGSELEDVSSANSSFFNSNKLFLVQNTDTIKVFSPLDPDSGDLAIGNKPFEMKIYNEIVKVNSWQEVLLSFLKYIYEKSNYEFDFIVENQYDLFKRDDVIVKWKKLKNILDNNFDLSNRYKTFDGLTWDKVKNLNDDVFFIHINISAMTCMLRISSIMEKLSMNDNDVLIKIK